MKTFLLVLLSVVSATAQSPTGHLEIYDVQTGNRQTIYSDSIRFEAPNWTHDNQFLIINQKGKLYKIAVKGCAKTGINTDFADRCNNDHGLSPDGKTLAISHNQPGGAAMGSSLVYVLPLTGGTPRQITEKGPSYWHGWSADGKTLAYTAQRNGDFDIYTMPASGLDASGKPATEIRLTDSPGLDDGPEYSPDGKYLYFNSVRSGKMQLWRIDATARSVAESHPVQLTNDPYNNWFPHVSPDNKSIVFISYLDEIDPSTHPADKNVMLRLMDVKTGKIRELTRFHGGQGTINVPSWSPDSKRFAFVSY